MGHQPVRMKSTLDSTALDLDQVSEVINTPEPSANCQFDEVSISSDALNHAWMSALLSNKILVVMQPINPTL
jgi:hypothetical protein